MLKQSDQVDGNKKGRVESLANISNLIAIMWRKNILLHLFVSNNQSGMRRKVVRSFFSWEDSKKDLFFKVWCQALVMRNNIPKIISKLRIFKVNNFVILSNCKVIVDPFWVIAILCYFSAIVIPKITNTMVKYLLCWRMHSKKKTFFNSGESYCFISSFRGSILILCQTQLPFCSMAARRLLFRWI